MQVFTQEPWLLVPGVVAGVYQVQSGAAQEEADMAAHPVGAAVVAAVVVAGGLVVMGPQVPPLLLLAESVHLQRVVGHLLVVMKVLQASTQPASAYTTQPALVEHSLTGLLLQPAGAAVVVGVEPPPFAAVVVVGVVEASTQREPDQEQSGAIH
jgi:hypothetical protein